jgi:hypothetical protein
VCAGGERERTSVQLAALAMIAATTAQSLACPPAPAPASGPARLERPVAADCAAPAPAPGASFSGTVLQVIDGRTICVAFGPTPDQWVRVRLSDAGANQLRGALMAAAFSRQVVCVTGMPDADGVVGVCAVDGRSVGRAAAEPDATTKAADWR